MEDKEKIAKSAASTWCRCFKCDGVINSTHEKCEKDKLLTCHKWYDGYRTALLALEEAEATSKVTSKVSKDLEEAAQEYTEKGSKCQEELDAFIAGANWQKQKDANLIFNAKEDGYRLGLATMKRQMMIEAVKVNISNTSIISLPVNCNLKVGDKVLIIKED